MGVFSGLDQFGLGKLEKYMYLKRKIVKLEKMGKKQSIR